MTSFYPTKAGCTPKDSPGERPTQTDMGIVCQIIEKHGRKESSVIAILQDIQARMNLLSRKARVQVAKSLDIPLAGIYGIGTFYKAFSLESRGHYTIGVRFPRLSRLGQEKGHFERVGAKGRRSSSETEEAPAFLQD
jgi:hypothetical protein